MRTEPDMEGSPEQGGEIRIDKWLWTVRLFKSRSQATEACLKGRISIGDIQVKPSRIVRINDNVKIKAPFITRIYLVKGIPDNRLSAKNCAEFVEEITPADEIKKYNDRKTVHFEYREPGLGRPTKRQRRLIDRLKVDE